MTGQQTTLHQIILIQKVHISNKPYTDETENRRREPAQAQMFFGSNACDEGRDSQQQSREPVGMANCFPEKVLKERIAGYWSCRAEGFEAQRLREYESSKKERWLAEFRKYLPENRSLKILDIGTGTGFFACILAACGHKVQGIDLSPEMIEHAGHMSSLLELDAGFQVMDAEKTDFPSDSFDALVTRNLTWTLPHVADTYREWFRILKPGGILINFDADYCAANLKKDDTPLPKNHAHKLLSPSLWEENEAITRQVGAVQKPRPQWDCRLLAQAGFEEIRVDTEVYRRIYREIDEFYNPTPIFVITASRPCS